MRLDPYVNSVDEYKSRYGDSWIKEFRLDKRASKDPEVYKKDYYNKVWKITEVNKSLVQHIDKRGYYQYHIDHKIPISIGYKNSIPPEIIADISNLHMLWWEDNMNKKDDLLIDEANKWIANYIKE